jgi:hypothetical protein
MYILEYLKTDIGKDVPGTNPEHNLFIDSLQCAIRNDSNITIDLIGIGYEDSDQYPLKIYFDSTLPVGEDSFVNTHVYNHDGIIYNFVMNDNPNIDIDQDYDILGLYKERIISLTQDNQKGYLKTVKYWKDYDAQTQAYSNLAIQENRVYTEQSFPGTTIYQTVKRDMSICWYRTNGIGGATKTTTKYYSFAEGRESMNRKRSNLVAEAEMIVLNAGLTQPQVQELLGYLSSDQLLYVTGDVVPVMTKIATLPITSPYSGYVTQQLADDLSGILNYWDIP